MTLKWFYKNNSDLHFQSLIEQKWALTLQRYRFLRGISVNAVIQNCNAYIWKKKDTNKIKQLTNIILIEKNMQALEYWKKSFL